MKICNLLLVLAIAAGSGAAYAASASVDGTKHSHEAGAAKHEGFGVVRGVNEAAGKVKIAHEPIPALKWPGMTMWFALHDPLPKEVKVGDSVRFELQQGKTGEWVITRIERKR